jgi:hypothetical protein
MNAQSSDQPDDVNVPPADTNAPPGKDMPFPGPMAEDELRALVMEQLGGATRPKGSQAELPAAADYIVTLEAHTAEMPGRGRSTRSSAPGTTLTPDQDAIDMDATIPKYPDPTPEE